MTLSRSIPPHILISGVFLIAMGEMLAGTDVLFVTKIAIALTAAGITYNLLGGLRSCGGIMFTAFAMCSLVISQVAKVLLFEPADHNLSVPALTSGVYAVYFVSAAIGVFFFGWMRVALPKPLEPETQAQRTVMYYASLVIGFLASFAAMFMPEHSLGHSFGQAFQYLLVFSLVLAVDTRMTETAGQHSLDWRVVAPAVLASSFGFVGTSRGNIILPVIIYLLACTVRGYKFRLRHYAVMAGMLVAFLTVISPFEMYSRNQLSVLGEDAPYQERIAEAMHIALVTPRSVWKHSEEAVMEGGHGSRDSYYDAPGTFVLSRLSMICPDGNLILSSAGGSHYGFTPLKMTLARYVPRFLWKDRPDTNGGYIGHFAGMESDSEDDTYWTVTAVGDSFAAFGWAGFIIYPMFFLPLIFVVYDSVFRMDRPWGTVAFGAATALFVEGDMSHGLQVLIRLPIALVALSWGVGLVLRMLPSKGERRLQGRGLLDPLPAPRPSGLAPEAQA